ncbi:ATP phosphoribosyltransferase regulatory subunit [Ammoniphilus sp. CFH 90114]|uniref:ATP phosphoribosyltransferase regulatory subunit n=1 Tax=Ammoniphilus sp. CFH 90114 TaxID=2493665 RepID=UPI00100FA8E0|nr:ATP phosphoribosyltransferase regulatory subunit [Ammoniphilus sp. CFH 90114]RXT04026.1 ATP phosphoribosyltransferase regulatory subunit [Ammoniphilus sp. CFH 90114]
MTKPLGFEKPLGMRDYLPEMLAKQRFVEEKLNTCMKRWGYQEILTPTLEYYDTVGDASATLDSKLFKLLDRQGRTLVLRPDVTAPIARVASSLLKDEPRPLRLMYNTSVFRAQQNEAGRNAEFIQSGVELIGDATVEADAEVIALAVASLQAAGLSQFKIAIGHVNFMEGLLEETVPGVEQREKLKERLHNSDYVGFRQDVEALDIPADQKSRLHGILKLRGGVEKLAEAEALTINGRARKAVRNLQELWVALQAYEVTDYIIFDLNLLNNINYYTGILFEGYAAGQGWPVCGGGRYDQLLSRFGVDNPSTGFAIKMDRLLQTSELQPPEEQRKIYILFDQDSRTEAIQKANELRQDAIVVTGTQQPTTKFDAVLDMRGGNGYV